MNPVVYEHPLNEKTRLLMRLELLFDQLSIHKDMTDDRNIQPFFSTLYSTIEVLERNDIRGTLAFYLDLLEKSMLRWSSHPDIHNDSLQKNLQETVKLQGQISKMSKACQILKEDKFLASLRQRFGIAGGTCDFDLPQFHFWRLKPLAERQDDIQAWLTILAPLQQALNFSMLFIRESAEFAERDAPNGFFQGSCADTVSLLRVKYDVDSGVFPTISGSNRRFAISFMRPDKSAVKTSVNDTIPFELATC
ncbi:cell division protein ZapD [Psychrosphaera ytuae]|uniref:Cell division protein ZapD n=1 Tax=Psychrosphaera ytuae TaxID=2820710 RepID=A0A975DAT8_9GAMM|nr:cell division protein ZapD [Psychrosphaera ytuae]QTH63514.1 cell division protein ZapD [Psychrosphaera ytuae]